MKATEPAPLAHLRILGIAIVVIAFSIMAYSWRVGFFARPLFHEARELVDRRIWPTWNLTGFVRDNRHYGYVDFEYNIAVLILIDQAAPGFAVLSDRFYHDRVLIDSLSDGGPGYIEIKPRRNELVVCCGPSQIISLPISSELATRFASDWQKMNPEGDIWSLMKNQLPKDDAKKIQDFVDKHTPPLCAD